jgi:hypothetical protein
MEELSKSILKDSDEGVFHLENHVFGLRPSYNADVRKLWGAPPGVGELFVFVGGGELVEGYIYF